MKLTTKNSRFSKMLALLLSVIMVLSMITVNPFGSVKAAGTVFTVTVTDTHTSKPISDVEISFTLENDENASFTATTDENGVAEVQEITDVITGGATSATIKYVATKEGYAEFTGTETVTDADGSMAIQMTDNGKPTISEVTPEAGWSKESIKFTVEASDNGSGVAYYSVDDNSDSAAWQTSGEFEIKDTDTHVYYVKDKAGNVSEGFTAEVAKIDDKGPEVELIQYSAVFDENTEKYRVQFDFSVQDAQSGIKSIAIADLDNGLLEVKKDGEALEDVKSVEAFNTHLENASEEERIALYSFSFHTEDIAVAEGKDVEVTVVDNVDNTTEKTLEVEKDGTSPIITDFKFTVAGKEVQPEDVEVEDYGYYFKSAVEVKIFAEDKPTGKEVSLGVAEITVVLRDKDGNKYYTVDDENGKIVEIKNVTDAKSCKVKDGDYITFTIEADFKGQIFAYATDNAGNAPVNREDNSLDGYEYPKGSILETVDKHKNTSSIVIEAPESSVTQNETGSYQYKVDEKEDLLFRDAEMSYNASKKVPLYNAKQAFHITVRDEYSGIRNVTVDVQENGAWRNEAELKITHLGAEDEKTLGTWKITKDNNSNLVYEATTSIEVDGAYNDMILRVVLTDRAGNVSYDYYMFGIDKSAPRITVTMNDNNDAHAGFFKANRTATFTIQERNFSNKDVTFTVTLTDENGVKKDINIVPAFVLEEEAGKPKSYFDTNGEYYIYTMNYTFDAEGDYTFDIKSKDLAANENAEVAYVNENGQDIKGISTAFTVDKKAPTVQVVYDNNSALNGNYYKADRTATITIAEHNFAATDVKVIGSATDNGAATSFPATSAWKDNGNNTYTATITYNADAKYSFDIEYLDKAGNSIADYAAEEFYVDKTAPALDITGVADKSANNGIIAPIITYTDTNFDKEKVTITLSGINNGGVQYSGTYADIANGQTYTYANFEEVQKVDDIYTLKVTLTDKAGNSTEKTITFSANRFGSVYDLKEVADINGKYLQKEQDIVFTETNVDTLDRTGIRIKLSKNGTPTDLVEGEDYTVEVTGGNGQWSQYKYTINKSLFADDGRYSISVYSMDAAGNINENVDESKEAEISFGIDKTKPVIVPIDFEGGVQYAVEEKTVSIEIKDNLVLQDVKIFLNDKEIEYTVEGNIYTFTIPASESKQDVKIVVTDAAGNEYELPVEGFLVSTNIFVRWYNNTPLFIGSIVGVVLLALGITILILFGKKKKEK